MLYDSQAMFNCLVPVQVCSLADSFGMGNTNALQNDSGLKKEEVFISRETQRREVTRNHQLLGTICLPDCIIQAGLPIPACRSQFRQAVRREFYLLLLLL